MSMQDGDVLCMPRLYLQTETWRPASVLYLLTYRRFDPFEFASAAHAYENQCVVPAADHHQHLAVWFVHGASFEGYRLSTRVIMMQVIYI